MSDTDGTPQKQKENSAEEKDGAQTLPTARAEKKHKTHKKHTYANCKEWLKRPWWFQEKDPVAKFTGWLVAYTAVLVAVSALQFHTLSSTDEKIGRQLNAMETDKQPWIRAEMTAEPSFTEWNGDKGINVRLKFVLKNHGETPAINVRIVPRIVQHPGNPKRRDLDGTQQEICAEAVKTAEGNRIGGFAIFPSETHPEDIPIGISGGGLFVAGKPELFSVLGCVDYTFSGTRHGQTGFRMLLGQVVKGQVHGLVFKEGEPIGDYNPSPELLSSGYPKNPPKRLSLKEGEFYFRPDDGGNYAK